MLELTQPINKTLLQKQHSEAPVEAKGKAIYSGTQRVCSPEDTLMRIRPLLTCFGITRIADVTHLDDLGLPVVQVVRPNSRNLSVSQGKGSTKALAMVSALMEAIELWHAEGPNLPVIWERIGVMQPQLPYSLYDLNLSEHHLLHDAMRLEWFPARVLGSAEETYVPADYVRLNFTLQQTWLPPTFSASSNGLASGNTYEEAILHGLYEVIERDTLARASAGLLPSMLIDPKTVDGASSAPILAQFSHAGASLEIHGFSGPTGIACFEVHLSSPSYPTVMKGSGCHLDRDVALSSALMEAAQVRLSVIAGARDDIQHRAYTELREMRTRSRVDEQRATADFHDIATVEKLELCANLDMVIERVRAVGTCPPLVVDLTRPKYTIPVVFVVVPQFRMVGGH
ncbi:MAG TPA: YcaO-like family protein [Ktedonobacteraceae bacterium]|nr:YcaO-like family protein [Ktedonobacteraceae bacterium]